MYLNELVALLNVLKKEYLDLPFGETIMLLYLERQYNLHLTFFFFRSRSKTFIEATLA